MQRILRFLNIIAIILMGVNWLALHDISKNTENLSGEWSFITVSYLIVLIILITNIIFLSFTNKKKQKTEE